MTLVGYFSFPGIALTSVTADEVNLAIASTISCYVRSSTGMLRVDDGVS